MQTENTGLATWSRRAMFISLVGVPLYVASATEETYEQTILRYREKAEEQFRSASGPLTLVARFSPHEGTSTLGRDPASTLVVTDKAAPAKIGTVTINDGKAILRFESSVEAMVDGKRVSVIETDNKFPQGVGATINALRVKLYFIRGNQLQIAIGDPNWILRQEAQPRSWFGVDKRYRVTANWVAYPTAKVVPFLDNDGSSRERKIPGYVTFTMDGQSLKLTPIIRPDNPNPFFVFGDSTNNHETYAAGRFLEADIPQDGKIILDFNKAYNPLCAYNHEFLCPVAPRENRLPIAIRAGEQKYPGNHSI